MGFYLCGTVITCKSATGASRVRGGWVSVFKRIIVNMLGSIIGGAVGVGASIFGGIKASQAMKKAKEMTQDALKENEDWYNRRYNEDVTQMADAQRVFTRMREEIQNRNRRAAGSQAVMGGTEESVAAQRGAGNASMAEAVSQVAASGARHKDAIERQYFARKGALEDQLRGYEVGKAQAVSQAAAGLADAAGSVGMDVEDWFDSRNNKG